MLSSIFYVLVMSVGIAALYINEKRKQVYRIQGKSCIVINVVEYILFQILVSSLLFCAHLPINKISLGISGAVLCAILYWKNKGKFIQCRFVNKSNCVIIEIFVLGVLLSGIYFFGKNMNIIYLSDLAAVNYKMSAQIALRGTMENAEPADIPGAVFLMILSPFFTTRENVHLFVLYNVFVAVLEIWMMYILFQSIRKKRGKKIYSVLIVVFCFLGFPLYCLYQGFSDWSIYNLLFMYFLFLYLNKEESWGRKRTICSVGIWVGIICLFYLRKYGFSIAGVKDVLWRTGDIYSSPFGDVIYFLPVVLALFYYGWRQNTVCKRLSICVAASIGFTAVMLILWWNDVISTFVYARMYYYIWTLGWLAVMAVVDVLAIKKELTGLMAYGGLIMFLSIASIVDLDGILLNRDEEIGNNQYSFISNNVPGNFMALYGKSIGSYRSHANIFLTEDDITAFEKAKESSENNIPYVTPANLRAKSLWYDGMTGSESEIGETTDISMAQLIGYLDHEQLDTVFVSKISPIYLNYQEYWGLHAIVWQDDTNIIYKLSGKNWTSSLEEKAGIKKEDDELVQFVKEELEDMNVPIVTEEQMDSRILYYDIMTGNQSDAYVGWSPDDLQVTGTTIFGTYKVQAVVVLKDTQMYQQNKAYWQQYENIFENGEAIIYKINLE